jgi:hypothetical protein
MRDIRKLFRRILNSKRKSNPEEFIEFSISHHLLFFIMSSVLFEESEKILESILILIKLSFALNDSEI